MKIVIDFLVFAVFVLGGQILSAVVSPLLNIKNNIEVVLLGGFFLIVFYLISLFIRDRFT